MSRSTNYTLTCPCGEVFTSQINEYVNVGKDRQLQYIVLAGVLNVSNCPACARPAATARPFIYSDPAHSLLAYVHPHNDVPEEARLLVLEKLRSVYENISGEAEQHSNPEIGGDSSSIEPADLATDQMPETPPLQVVFGSDQLHELLNAVLSQEERLGKLALNTPSRDTAERGQLPHIARKLTPDTQCPLAVEDLSDEYTVWLFGSRRQIGALMREFAARG